MVTLRHPMSYLGEICPDMKKSLTSSSTDAAHTQMQLTLIPLQRDKALSLRFSWENYNLSYTFRQAMAYLLNPRHSYIKHTGSPMFMKTVCLRCFNKVWVPRNAKWSDFLSVNTSIMPETSLSTSSYSYKGLYKKGWVASGRQKCKSENELLAFYETT